MCACIFSPDKNDFCSKREKFFFCSAVPLDRKMNVAQTYNYARHFFFVFFSRSFACTIAVEMKWSKKKIFIRRKRTYALLFSAIIIAHLAQSNYVFEGANEKKKKFVNIFSVIIFNSFWILRKKILEKNLLLHKIK